LICVVVVPVTGGRVGIGVGGSGVRVGGAGRVGGKVAVTRLTVGAGGGDALTPQPTLSNPSRIKMGGSLEVTN
jgi:hypothetical protein